MLNIFFVILGSLSLFRKRDVRMHISVVLLESRNITIHFKSHHIANVRRNCGERISNTIFLMSIGGDEYFFKSRGTASVI